MATYSLAQTGVRSDAFPKPVANVTLPDSMVPSGTNTLTTATLGGMQNAMQNNTHLLCKGPDGATHVYTLDPERSTPTIPVLRRMRP